MAALMEGFMKGYTWGNNLRLQKEQYEFIKQERERMSMERDADKFIRAYNTVRGGRDAAEFAESGDFDKLVFQYRDNKFVEDMVNDGMVKGKKAKLKSIGVHEATGMRAFMVDTFDDEGNKISSNRPITLGRRSREDAPGDTPLLLTGGDFHNYVVSEMSQYKGFEDRWGAADRAADTSAALYKAMFGDPKEFEKNLETNLQEYEKGIDKLPKEIQEDVERAGMTKQEAVEADPLELPEIKNDNDLVGLNNRIKALEDRRDNGHKGVYERYSDVKPEPGEDIEAFRQRIRDMQAEDPDYQALKEEQAQLRDLKVKQRELRQEVLANPTGERAQLVADNFLDTQAAGAGALISQPEVMGASRSDKQAIGKGQQRGMALGQKPATQAQARAILNQKRKTAEKFINKARQSKKDFENFVRALQTQVARGEISGGEMANQVAGFMKLKAEQAKGNKDITHVTQNDTIVWYNKTDGSIVNIMRTPGDDDGTKGGTSSGSYLTDFKKMIDLMYPDKDDPRRQSAIPAVDRSANVMDYGLDQSGALAMNMQALQYRQAAINEAADWNPFVGIDDAEAMYPSLTPFMSAIQLGVPASDAQDYTEKVAEAFGSTDVPEAVWRDILKAAFDLTAEGNMTHEQALNQVLSRLRQFKQQQGG